MWMPQNELSTCAAAGFRGTGLGGVGENISHLPTPPTEPLSFVEPLFALSSPGSDLFALWDGESVTGMEGWREMEERRLLICIRSLAPFRPAGFDKWRQ